MSQGINNSTGAAVKNKVNFNKANTKFCLNLHYYGDKNYLFLNKTEINKSKANDNIGWYNRYRKHIKRSQKR